MLETQRQDAERDGNGLLGLLGTTIPSSRQKDFKACKVDYILLKVFYILILVCQLSSFPLPVKRHPSHTGTQIQLRREGIGNEAAKAETAQTVLRESHSPSSEHLFMPST